MAGALGAIGTGSASVLTSCAGESAAANKPLKEPGTLLYSGARQGY